MNIHSSIISLENESVELEVELKSEEMIIFNLKNSKFNLNQKVYFESLKILSWQYEHFVISAIYFHVEKLYETYSKREKLSLCKKKN